MYIFIGHKDVMSTDADLQILQTYIVRGWSQNIDGLETTLQGYWSLMHKLAITDDVAVKGKQIIIPFFHYRSRY